MAGQAKLAVQSKLNYLFRLPVGFQGRVTLVEFQAACASEDRALANLVRDVFGNPFRPVEIDSQWRTTNVAALAQTIYEERAFERMPILGDALEESGCDNTDILNHCRQPGEHVRGCWVVDLLLGKS
jgi:hypothetical protein